MISNPPFEEESGDEEPEGVELGASPGVELGASPGVEPGFSPLFVQEQDESVRQMEKTSVNTVKTRRNFFIKNNSFSIKIDIHQYFNIKKLKKQQKS